MPYTFRIIYRSEKGRNGKNFWSPIITRDSTVIITAAEWRQDFRDAPYDDRGETFLGAADVYVTNIAPHNPPAGSKDGGVGFYLHADTSGEPIHVQVTITVLNPIDRWLIAEG